MRARWIAALAACFALVIPAMAAPPQADLPYAAYAGFVRQLHERWYVPRSAEFAEASRRFAATLQASCESGPARAGWLQTVTRWERLSAVRGGALLARRSPREIDFMPTRPEAIAKAIRSAPADAAALDRIGSPAKGLPALEWLLWSPAGLADPVACRYAQLAAAAVADEAAALQQAYKKALANGWDDSAAEYAMYEFLNLWDAGVQKLWWEEIDKPQQKATAERPAAFGRAPSGHTVAGWRLQWSALRELAVGEGQREGGSIRAYLLVQGQADAAARLLAEVSKVDQAMAGVAVTNPSAPTLAAAVAALKDLQQFAETDMATALHFVISFFDEDGD